MSDSTAIAVLGFIMTYLIVLVIYAIIAYIFTALGYYTMAKNKGIDHAWMAWIPIVNNYLMGEIIDDVVAIGDNKIPYAKWVLLFAPFVVAVIAAIPYIGLIISVLYSVYVYFSLYRLYKLYNEDKAVLFLVLSIIFAIAIPFFVFALRNRTPQEYLN